MVSGVPQVIIVDANGNRYLQLPSDTSSVRSHSPARSINSITSNTTFSTVSSVSSRDHTKPCRLIVKENGRLVQHKFASDHLKVEWIRKHRPDLLRPRPSPVVDPVATAHNGPYRTLDENYHLVTNNTTNNTTNNISSYNLTNYNLTNYNLTYNYPPQVLITQNQVGDLVKRFRGPLQ
jgi:hypothetical protein